MTMKRIAVYIVLAIIVLLIAGCAIAGLGSEEPGKLFDNAAETQSARSHPSSLT
jgi:hypothetical protein